MESPGLSPASQHHLFKELGVVILALREKRQVRSHELQDSVEETCPHTPTPKSEKKLKSKVQSHTMDNTVLHVKQSLKWVWLPCASNTQCPRAKVETLELKPSLSIQQDATPQNKQTVGDWRAGLAVRSSSSEERPCARWVPAPMSAVPMSPSLATSALFLRAPVLFQPPQTLHTCNTHSQRTQRGRAGESSSVSKSTHCSCNTQVQFPGPQLLVHRAWNYSPRVATPLAWGHLHLPANTHN